ncbi:class I SAM-dependent methyltransferase [Streptomyces albus]|uniref:methyltransferase domain-containing protein n=1 Tax=Streptomyces albus TaxID=1888 RepID=UPI00068BBB11
MTPQPAGRGKRPLAELSAAAAPVRVEVVDGIAERLPLPDASFDAAVVCLTLCSVDDPHAALAELHRVLRAGGQLRFFEHVRRRVHGHLAGDVRLPRDARSLPGGHPHPRHRRARRLAQP